MPAGAGAGPYLVSWSVRAADGDATRGEIRFRVGTGNEDFQAACDRAWISLDMVSRAAAVVFLLSLVGIAAVVFLLSLVGIAAVLVIRARLRARSA